MERLLEGAKGGPLAGVEGDAYARCTPYSYSQGPNPSALITCYDALGGAVSAPFSVQWLLGLPV